MSRFDEITNNEDVIDSRDIIERIEYLQDEADTYQSENKLPSIDWTEKWDGSEYVAWDKRHRKHNMDWAVEKWGEWEYLTEYCALKSIESECEGYGDWKYGETLIRRSYFQDYIEELIEDCYEMPKEMNSGNWPWGHMKFDLEAAAEEAEDDYMEVDFSGVEYLMRSA